MIRFLRSDFQRCSLFGRLNHAALLMAAAALLMSSCSRRESSEADEAEWADIQPITNTAATVLSDVVGSNQTRRAVHSEGEDYAPLIRRMEEMKTIVRASGETMITGETLIFDYERRFVRMDQEVKVTDDHGVLETETLLGRFSDDESVEMIEARKGVRIVSEDRTATAENAVYSFKSGAIQLDGSPQVALGGNRLTGEQIRFWIKDSRRMICESNAVLVVTGTSDLKIDELEEGGGNTEIRSDRLVYNEDQALAEFDGNVRLRHPKASLNSQKVRLHLKESNKIDWIEALYEIIIQSDDRKALADRATYHADEGKFTLEGDPKIMLGQNVMTGDRIIFWLETERMVCDPNARVMFYPDEEMKAKFLKDLKD
jgi:lipopolysaccharide export system protein LptA